MTDIPSLPVVPSLPVEFPPDELVVDLPYRDLVTRELSDLGIGFVDDDVDERLGLALVTGLVDAAGNPVADLDGLMLELRRQISGRYPGWTPEIGKNRRVQSIVAAGYPKPLALGVAPAGGHREPLGNDDPTPAPGPVPASGASPDAGLGVRVGILDTRLAAHPTLVGGITTDHELFVPDGAVPVWAGHATFVASLIRAQAPAADLDVRAVLDDETGKATSWETAKKMVSFADSGIDILNLSLGCRTSDGLPPLVLTRAVERLHPHTLVVAAAGNHGALTGWVHGLTRRSPTWPGALVDVVAVGADNADRTPADFGPRLPWVTCTARGADVVGAYLTGTVQLMRGWRDFTGFARWSGTSFAAATASGRVAALTMPGKTTARQALDDVLADGDPNDVVRRRQQPR